MPWAPAGLPVLTVATLLKSGGDFSVRHVERLQGQIAKVLPDAEFVCLSDVPVPCRRIPLIHDQWVRWWGQIELFRPGLFTGPVLYMDLDTIVRGPLDDLLAIGNLALLWDFYRPAGLGSGLMVLPECARGEVWREWIRDPGRWMGECALGGDQMFLCGDLFHQRGEIKPSVFNPTISAFKAMLAGRDLSIDALPGNHDLEGKDASTYGNAMQELESLFGASVHVKPTRVGDVWVFPWFADLNELRAQLKKHADKDCDAVIHAPVNGVIKGIPDHGLEAKELAALGYRRVFSGHYHDHKVMEGGKVVSIGATAHQTWSDPGTTAGFILVWEDRIEHFPSNAPKFVDLDLPTVDQLAADGIDVDDYVRGNYVRLKLDDVSEKEIKDWRDDITNSGAAGVIVLATKKNLATARTGAGAASSAISLGASVEHYIRADMKPALLIEEISREAQDVLMEAQS